MEYVKKHYKIILKYTFLFSLFMFYNIYVQQLNGDEVWNF